MTDIATLITLNAHRWTAMVVKPDHIVALDKVVTRMWLPPSFRARYEAISKTTGVPAPFIMLAHYRESDGDWHTSLAQGDSLVRRSVHVPAGRIPPPAQPPFTFEQCAVDALTAVEQVNHWTDWSIGGMLTRLEMYNGIGYARMGLPSAYVWAQTNQYLGGKYTSDGHFERSEWDVQNGVAAVLARMMALDSGLTVAGATLNIAAIIDHAKDAPNSQTMPQAHDTEWLQHALNTLGQHEPFQHEITAALSALHPPGRLPLVEDGLYGAQTKEAVRGFQRAAGGLLDDGKAGAATMPKIVDALSHLDH